MASVWKTIGKVLEGLLDDRVMESILGPHYERPRTICRDCIRDGDTFILSTFGDLSLCGRCRQSVTSKTPAVMLTGKDGSVFRGSRADGTCIVCWSTHFDACSQDTIDEMLKTQPKPR